MPTTYGPLLSLSASGSIAKTLNFQRTRRGTRCVRHSQPTGEPSAAQITHRARFRRLASAWRSLTTAQKATWETLSEPADTTTYAAYTAYNWSRITRNRCAVPTYAPTTEYLYDALALYCPMNEGQGTAIYNNITGGHGTLLNADQTAAWSTVPGALTLDGVDDRVDADTLPPLYPTNTYTFGMRLSITNLPHNSFIYAVNNPANTTINVAIYVNPAAQLTFTWFSTDRTSLTITSTQTVPLNTPANLTATYDGTPGPTSVGFWINGVPCTTSHGATPTDYTTANGRWALGGRTYANDRNLAATIYGLWVWGRMLSANELTQFHANPPTPIRVL